VRLAIFEDLLGCRGILKASDPIDASSFHIAWSIAQKLFVFP
jgi:hypothetical protein